MNVALCEGNEKSLFGVSSGVMIGEEQFVMAHFDYALAALVRRAHSSGCGQWSDNFPKMRP